MRAFAVSVMVVVVTAGVAQGQSATEPFRVVDQTYLCKVAVNNGVREIAIEAQRGFREGGRQRWFARASVANENGGPPAKLPPTPQGQIPISYQNWGFGAAAGLDLAHPEPSPPLRPYRAGVTFTPRRACVATRARVPLTPRGLDGGPADYFGDEVECSAPATMLVRIRAVFVARATLRTDRSSGDLRTQRASGAVREAHVAVRTATGRPLAYATASASGSARLFTAAGCTFR